VAYAYQTEDTQSALFFTLCEKFGTDIFMRAKLKNGEPCDDWVETTWQDAAEQALLMGSGLIEMGIEYDDCVAIFAHNRPRWIIADQAIIHRGADISNQYG